MKLPTFKTLFNMFRKKAQQKFFFKPGCDTLKESPKHIEFEFLFLLYY